MMSSQALSWPQTQGHVIQSDLENNKLYYRIFIEYEYEVNGQIYHNHRLSPDSPNHYDYSTPRAKAFLKEYPVGKKVDVFFNPKKPQEATLNLSFGGWVMDHGRLFTNSWGMDFWANLFPLMLLAFICVLVFAINV